MLFFEFCFLFMLFLLYVFFDCKCKSLNILGENIYNKQNEKNIKKHKKIRTTRRQTEKQHKYRMSSPRTSANILCDLFAEVLGLDIMYFCCLFMFVFEFVCVVYDSFCCVLCVRLVVLSFCICNRKNTYNKS